MALRLFDYGGEDILKVYFEGASRQTTFSLLLFTSPTTLADTTVLVEAAGGGYTRKAIAADGSASAVSWTAAYPGGIPIIQWGEVDFVFTGPLTSSATIYGYALIKGTAGTPHTLNDVIFAELLNNPFKPMNNGDKLTIQANFKLGNGTPT